MGTAGSSGLVFQTVFPALLTCEAESQVFLQEALTTLLPPYGAITESYLPALANADIRTEATLVATVLWDRSLDRWLGPAAIASSR